MSINITEINKTDLSVAVNAASDVDTVDYNISWFWESSGITAWSTNLASWYTASTSDLMSNLSSMVFLANSDYLTSTITVSCGSDGIILNSYDFYSQHLYVLPISSTVYNIELNVVLQETSTSAISSLSPLSTVIWSTFGNIAAMWINGASAGQVFPLSATLSGFVVSGIDYLDMFTPQTADLEINYPFYAYVTDSNRTTGTYVFTVNSKDIKLSPYMYDTADYTATAVSVELQGYDTFALDTTAMVAWNISSTPGLTVKAVDDSVYTMYTIDTYDNLSAIQLEYTNIDTSYTIGTTAYNLTLPTTSGYTTLTGSVVYTPQLEPTSITISAINFNNLPFIRSSQFKVKGYRPGYGYHDVGDQYNVRWIMSQPDLDSFWAYDNNHSLYTFDISSGVGASGLAINFDTLWACITTNTFTAAPKLCSYALTAEYINSTGTILLTSYSFTIDEFPAPSIFDVNFKLNNEDTAYTHNMFRANSAYNVTPVIGTNTSNIPGFVLGTYYWNSGGSIGTGTPISLYSSNLNNDSTVTITMTAYSVLAAGWLLPHSDANYINLRFGDLLSADFAVAPTYAWNTSASRILVGSESVLALSPGASSYGEGHTEAFILSARTLDGTSYNWLINTVPYTGRVASINVGSVPNDTFNATGTAVGLTVYNNDFPSTMSLYHTADSGVAEYYPNFKWTTTSNSNKLFQNIRVFPYENVIASMGPYTNEIITLTSMDLTAIKNLGFGPVSPVRVSTDASLWVLSSAKWSSSITTNTTNFNFTLTSGNGVTPGTISQYDSAIVFTLSVSGTIGKDIPDSLYSPPYDWQTISETYTIAPITMTAINLPELRLFTTTPYVLTGQNVTFTNGTTPNGNIATFTFNNGNGQTTTVADYRSFTTSYTAVGVYSVTLSATTNTGFSYASTYHDAVHVVAGYLPFNSNITRVYGEVLSLPYSLGETLIPPNEWVTHDNINAAFDKLNDNLSYIEEKSHVYVQPPINYLGWLGTAIADSNLHWRLGSSVSAVAGTLSDARDIAVKNNMLYVINDTTVYVLSSDYNATIAGSRTYKTIGESFVNPIAIDVDSRSRIYVLDSTKNKVMVFSLDTTLADPWRLLYEWGGLGGASARTKFQSPTDLYVDSNDHVWVADAGNGVIKQYSGSGGWLQTIASPYMANIISVAVDSDHNLHVLTSTNIVKLTNAGSLLKIYNYPNTSGALPKRIIPSYDGGFVYVCFADKIIKIATDGTNASIFADGISNTYSGIYHDSNRNFYIANKIDILKYYDTLVTLSIKLDTDSLVWNINDINIDKDEFIQDWVYNRSLSRLWDNIEIIKRSIIGTIISTKSSTGGTILTIGGFTPEEYISATGTAAKSNVFVGVNEFVTAPVVNRCLTQLYDMEEKILELIS